MNRALLFMAGALFVLLPASVSAADAPFSTTATGNSVSSIEVEASPNTVSETATLTYVIHTSAAWDIGTQFYLMFSGTDLAPEDTGFDFESAEYDADTIPVTCESVASPMNHAAVLCEVFIGMPLGNYTLGIENVVLPSIAGSYEAHISTDELDPEMTYVTAENALEIVEPEEEEDYTPAKKVKNLKVKKANRKKKKATATWKKHSYKTQLKLQKYNKKKKKYKKHKSYTVKKNKKKKLMKSLKPGTKYRVRARKVRTVDGTKYYSEYTSWVKFKTNE